MKVLVFSQFWFPENGVPQRRWTWLSSVLRDHGNQCIAIVPHPHYRRKVGLRASANSFLKFCSQEKGPSGEMIFRVPFVPSGESLFGRAISQAVISGGALFAALFKPHVVRQVDLIVGTVPALPTAIVTFIVAKVYRKPYVVDLRDAWPELLSVHKKWDRAMGKGYSRYIFPSLGLRQLFFSTVEKVLLLILDHADGIIVTSADLEEKTKSRRREAGKLDDVVENIPNVFPAAIASVERRKEVRQTGSLRIIYAGTIGRAQNLQNAVEAVKIASSRGIDIELRLVGAGAAVEELKRKARLSDGKVSVFELRSAHDLSQVYSWADTALVHLTDWVPLSLAIPSKTFELIYLGLHITGVVKGETARLISDLHAGDIVPPEDPVALANLWERLANERERLEVSEEGREWILSLRNEVVPHRLGELFSRVVQ